MSKKGPTNKMPALTMVRSKRNPYPSIIPEEVPSSLSVAEKEDIVNQDITNFFEQADKKMLLKSNKKPEKTDEDKAISIRLRKLYGTRTSVNIIKGRQTLDPGLRDQKMASSELENNPRKKKTCKESLVISHESKWKSYFDVVILFMVGYSCFTSIYYLAFSMPTSSTYFVWYYTVECFFYSDLILNFFQEFKDPDTLMPVNDMRKIAIHYMTGWFIIDFVSVFPFEELFNIGSLTKLFRLFRMPRLIKLIDITRFDKLLKSFQSDKSNDQTIQNRYFILKMYNIFRLVIIAIMITYFIGCIGFYISRELNQEVDILADNTLVRAFDIDINPASPRYNESQPAEYDQFITMCYFALTTLSTVGYGDFTPISKLEMIFTVIVMLGGVAFFSYIMSNFVTIIANYESKMGAPDRSPEL